MGIGTISASIIFFVDGRHVPIFRIKNNEEQITRGCFQGGPSGESQLKGFSGLNDG
jgi:hypothetical protein